MRPFTYKQRVGLGITLQPMRRTKRGLELPRVPSRAEVAARQALVAARKALGSVWDWLAKERKPPRFRDAPKEPSMPVVFVGAVLFCGLVVALVAGVR